MIQTYDWIFYARNHPDYRRQIEQAISDTRDRELTFRKTHRMKFDGKSQTIIVQPYAADIALSWKIVPARLTYRSVRLMLNDKFEELREDDICLL